MVFFQTNLTALSFAFMGSMLFCQASVQAQVTETAVFEPPQIFGVAFTGSLSSDAPYLGKEVTEVRVYWDIVVQPGSNAADSLVDVTLPVIQDGSSLLYLNLDGTNLGWSGSGTFNYQETFNPTNTFFGQADMQWGSQAFGLTFTEVTVLDSSRIEIDYIVPEPSSLALLGAGGFMLYRRRRD